MKSISTFILLSVCSLFLQTQLLSNPQNEMIAQAAHKEKDSGCICSPKQISKAFTAVAKKATPAVVFIKVQSAMEYDEEVPGGRQNPFDYFGDDFLRRFFGYPPNSRMPERAPQISQGSGFLVSPDGFIMTNAHVVKGADKITVVLNDGRELDAALVGADSHTDVAIIKAEGKNFPYLNLGNSDDIETGEWVVAIGSPFQLDASLTVGVVSAKGRQNLRIADLEDFIQTDAAINPGNSGGPLLDLDGEVIGINTAIVSRTGGYMGIGFAIPSNMAKNIMAQIIDKGVVTRGFLGVSLQPVDKEIADAFNLDKAEGVLISEVMKDSPAEKADLQQGDIILEYNGMPIKSLGSFRNDISLMKPGTEIKLKINRRGEMLTKTVKLGTASDSMMATGGIVSKLGLEVENLTPETAKQLGYSTTEPGVVITKIKPGSLSALAGLRPGFLIVAIDHKKISNVNDFNEAINSLGNQKRVLLLVRQGNMTRFYSIRLE
jgi:serine protease Do